MTHDPYQPPPLGTDSPPPLPARARPGGPPPPVLVPPPTPVPPAPPPPEPPTGQPAFVPPAGVPPMSDEVLATSRTHRLADATDHQRVVYALVARTLFEYRSDRILLAISFLLIPFTIAVGAAIGFAVSAGVGWLLSKAGLGDVLVVLVGVLALLIGRALRKETTDADVALAESGGRVKQLKLGRLESMFQVVGPATLGLFFGLIFGTQHALLMFTPSHFGLPIQGGLAECFLLTLDNACHGIFLDTFELYDINLGQKQRHTDYSATVFYLFRVAFDAIAFLIGFALWKRFQLRRFFYDFPRDERDVPGVMTWITYRCNDRDRWPQKYHDEFVFLLLCKAFVAGDHEFVRRLSTELNDLRVTPAVRSLFQAADGTVVFHGSHE